jgi:hypothetical protein
MESFADDRKPDRHSGNSSDSCSFLFSVQALRFVPQRRLRQDSLIQSDTYGGSNLFLRLEVREPDSDLSFLCEVSAQVSYAR